MAESSASAKSVSQTLVEVLKDLEQKLIKLDVDLRAAQSELNTERAARKKIESASGELATLGSSSDELEEEIKKRRKLEGTLIASQDALKQAQKASGSESLLKEIEDLKEEALKSSGGSEALQTELGQFKEAWQKGSEKAEEDIAQKNDELARAKAQYQKALKTAGNSESLQKEIEELKKSNDEYQRKLTEALSNISSSEALQKEIDELNKANEESRSQLAEALSNASGSETLQKEIDNLKKAREEDQIKLDEALKNASGSDVLNNTISSLERELEETRKKAKAELDSKSDELDRTRDGLIGIQKELQATQVGNKNSEEINSLKKTIAELKNSNDKLSSEINKAKSNTPTTVRKKPAAKAPPKRVDTAPTGSGAPPEAASLIQALKNDPKDAKILRKLADVYINHDMFDEALSPLKTAVKLNPRSPELLFQLGNAYYKTQHFQESLPPLSQAIRMKPKYAQAHYVLCMVNELVGNEEAAQKHYQIALKLNPKIEESM